MSQNVFTLEALTAWLDKQPADERYNYIDNQKCVLGLYAKSVGLHYDDMKAFQKGLLDCRYGRLTVEHLVGAGYDPDLVKKDNFTCGPHTWGAAAKRAYVLMDWLKENPVPA